MSETHEHAQHADGPVAAAIASSVVRLVREYTGRGPISPDLVTVVMGDMLTKAERKLVESGKADLVLNIRHEFQRTMRQDLIAAVEMMTERKVIAFMSDNHIDPDMAIEAFVLEPQPAAV